MPIFRNRLVVEIARGMTGFVNLEAGLSRQSLPDTEMLTAQVAALRSELAQRDRRIEHLGRQLEAHQEDGPNNLDGIANRLYDLGYVDRTLEELHNLAYSQRPTAKKLAAWELCQWHANRYSAEDARRCLEYLPSALEDVQDPDRLRQAAIVEAESHDLLGDAEQARSVLSKALERGPHADLFLARANLEDGLPGRVSWINAALRLHGAPEVSCDADSGRPPLDALSLRGDVGAGVEVSSATKVSVIVPVYDAEDVLPTALDSLLAQTWTNLEVLIVDDRSADGTASLVEEYEERDPRVRLIRAEENGGAYVARNLALREATGEFVTCHDADDWSHPEKVEYQARHLLANPSVVGNNSQQVRCTEDLRFFHRGKIHFLLRNGSSLMFRREPVMRKLGYWDCVRFGADNEFRRRLQKAFGEEAVVTLETGPVSFTRQSGRSLTELGASGVYVPMGARKEYRRAYTHFHERAEDLRYDFPQPERPFPAPEPMWVDREVGDGERRRFDVVLVSDFRLPGGTTSSNVEEIKAQKRLGLRTGLIHVQRFMSNPNLRMNPKIRDVIDGDAVQMLVYGEKVSCEVLNVRYPPTLQDRPEFLPDVEAARANVIMNQTPMKRYGDEDDGEGRVYEPGPCEQNLRKNFGRSGMWYPIGPSIRNALHEHHAEELKDIELANENWSNIIDVDEWRRGERPPRGPRPRIGRHSRDTPDKWPTDRDELLAVYPGDYEVRVLGGAEAPKEVLGGLPENWHVLEFGAAHPKDFLSGLDVFVYYTSPELVEAFGRAIVEAMATGVPAILPHRFRELFGEAAIYAETQEVRGHVDRLMDDDALYESRVEAAREYVEKHFGYTKHAERLGIKARR